MTNVGPNRPAHFLYNGKMISLTPDEYKLMKVTGYQVTRNGQLAIYENDAWRQVGSLGIRTDDFGKVSDDLSKDKLVETLKAQENKILSLLKISENDLNKSEQMERLLQDREKRHQKDKNDELAEELGLELDDEDEEMDYSDPEWIQAKVPIFLPNGGQYFAWMWLCPICAGTVPREAPRIPKYGKRNDWPKDHHENYHKTIACDWYSLS